MVVVRDFDTSDNFILLGAQKASLVFSDFISINLVLVQFAVASVRTKHDTTF